MHQAFALINQKQKGEEKDESGKSGTYMYFMWASVRRMGNSLSEIWWGNWDSLFLPNM